MLAGAVNYLLNNPAARRDMIAAGASAVEEMRGALDRTFRALDPFIQPLMVQSRLRNGNGAI
jgi:3-deoxy-D-manno-octulosonic-acid transferase